MKKLLILAALAGNPIPIASNIDVPVLRARVSDESFLETKFYKASSNYEVEDAYIQIKKLTNGEFSIETDFEEILNRLVILAGYSGLLNGKTNYELIGKENIFIDGYAWKNSLSSEVTTKDGETTRTRIFHYTRLFSTGHNKLIVSPLPIVTKIKLAMDWMPSDLIFGDRRKIFVDTKSGHVNFGNTWQNRMELSDLFRDPTIAYDNSEYLNSFAEYDREVRLYFNNNGRPFSPDFDITWANQGSALEDLSKGYNITIDTNVAEDPLPFNPFILWLFIGTIVFPFSYFLIKKLLKK